MKIKRLISLLLTLMLLAGTAPALAADAGSRQDPLLSHSFVDSWSSAVLSHAEATAHSAAQAALDKALQTHDAALHSTAAKSRICTLNAGSTVALKTGDCFTVLSGSAGVTISAGVLVDTTDGKKAASGALHTAHRYIACENLRATITCEQTVSLLVSASASVTRFVDVPAGAWYADAVEYVAANGLMGGVGGRCFAPNDALTRAMFRSTKRTTRAFPSPMSRPGAGTRRMSNGPRSKTSSTVWTAGALNRTRRSRANRWRPSSRAMCRAPEKHFPRSPTLSRCGI